MGERNKNILFDNRVFEREKKINARSKIFSHLSATGLGVFFVVLLFQFGLDGLKGMLVDLMFRTQWRSRPHADISLIAYDDDAAQRYDRTTKLPAEELAQVFDVLASEKPRAVAVIATIDDKLYSEAELQLIAKAFSKVPNTYVGYVDDENLGKSQPTVLNLLGRYLPGFVSRDTFSYGADSVSRRVMVNIEGFPTVYARIACQYRGIETADCWKGRRYERLGDSIQTYINWQGPAGTYATTSSRLVAEHGVPAGRFTNKIVLVGTKLQAKRATDYILTPYSRQPYQTPLLEGAAHSLATLMRDDGLYKTPNWLNWVLTLVIGILTVNMVLFLPPGRGIAFVVGEAGLLVLGSWIALLLFDSWVDLAHPLVVACVGYYLVIPYRLVDEYRKRWHYQEKSELMAQLEQLKSNFLSLISHDLKTPIARIQGNAELVLNESGKMSEKQKKSLAAIIHTTEDLSEYVETVLDLTRIESAQVPVLKVTKDINAIITDVIESKRFLAVEKNIHLETELEPIFSFKFDVKLMRRVLANLVENAIKYSPEGSTIVMSSREEGNWVRVAVTDHGPGIAPEEQQKVFFKFYRCNTDQTRDVKGTGLGLYLVKYFVELHQGIVDLKSELGKGSTFTVSLPV